MKLANSLILEIMYFMISRESQKKEKNLSLKMIGIFICFKILIIKKKREISLTLRNSYQKMPSYGILNKKNFSNLELKVVCRLI
jgi:hypothetical protein